MFSPTTCEDSRSATSSPASAAGRLRCEWPGGTTRDLFGPAPALANLSASKARSLGLLTSGTYGRPSSISSSSAALQSSLESRLRVLLTGSHLCKVIWKPWVSPLGRSQSKPRALVPRIDVTASGGLLPTPSGTSNHGKNHVSGRIDEWGGSSNYFRGTPDGNKHLPGFELWTMGFPDAWRQLMPPAMPSSRRSRRDSFKQHCKG